MILVKTSKQKSNTEIYLLRRQLEVSKKLKKDLRNQLNKTKISGISIKIYKIEIEIGKQKTSDILQQEGANNQDILEVIAWMHWLWLCILLIIILLIIKKHSFLQQIWEEMLIQVQKIININFFIELHTFIFYNLFYFNFKFLFKQQLQQLVN